MRVPQLEVSGRTRLTCELSKRLSPAAAPTCEFLGFDQIDRNPRSFSRLGLANHAPARGKGGAVGRESEGANVAVCRNSALLLLTRNPSTGLDANAFAAQRQSRRDQQPCLSGAVYKRPHCHAGRQTGLTAHLLTGKAGAASATAVASIFCTPFVRFTTEGSHSQEKRNTRVRNFVVRREAGRQREAFQNSQRLLNRCRSSFKRQIAHRRLQKDTACLEAQHHST